MTAMILIGLNLIIVELLGWIGLNLIIVALLGCGVYMMLQSITLIEAAKRNAARIYSELHSRDEKRVLQAEQERRRFGTVAKRGKGKNFLTRLLENIDNKLSYSGMNIRFPWLNTSIYVVACIVAAVLAFLAALTISRNILIAVLAAAAVTAAPYCGLSIKADDNYKRTEEQMEFFVSMVSNNSMTTSELITVLENTAPYMLNPIKGALERATAKAKISGKSSDCIAMLCKEVEHPIFVHFLQNLEICSRHDADYHKVAKNFSAQVEEAVKTSAKQRAIISETRVNIFVLLILGGFLLSQMCANFGESLYATIIEMMNSTFGMVVLGIEMVILMAVIIYMIIGFRR